MFTELRTAAWFADETKRNYLRSMITDPVFQEVVSLILDQKAEGTDHRFTASEVLARQWAREQGMRFLLSELERFTLATPPPAMPLPEPFAQYNSENYQPQ